jgi:hypothetical protein
MAHVVPLQRALRINRRNLLSLGASTGLALAGMPYSGPGFPSLPGPSRATANAEIPGFGRARSVILIYCSGGQSQLDLWDPKPQAPAEVRGAFRPISTAISGTQFCEHLPNMAKLADRFTVIRSMSHEDVDHGSATYLALTGHYHGQRSANPPPRPDDQPTFGSVLKRVRPSPTLPFTAVHLNGPALVPELPAPGQNAGFLGYGHDPLLIGDVTENATPLRGLEPLSDLTERRTRTRRTLLESVEAAREFLGENPSLLEMQDVYRQAYNLLAVSEIRHAFDLSLESERIRDRYGRNRSGQACLMARRLVEAGAPWVTVIWCPSNRGQDNAPDDTNRYGWDTHNDIFDALRNHLLPRFDQGVSTLLVDLEERGLLDQTLVVCMGEFGRAPLVALEPRFAGATPGRKHWSSVYSIVLAGAGISRGAVYGASDRHGAYPRLNPVGPWDIAATMFAALGIDPAGHFEDQTSRPFPIASGRPIAGLYA